MFESAFLAKSFLALIIIIFVYSTLINFSYAKLTLAIIFIFLLKLIITDELALLIHPRYFWLTKAAAVVVFLMIVFATKEKQKLSRGYLIMLTALNIIFVFCLFTKFKPLSSNSQGSSNIDLNLAQFSRDKRLTNFHTNTDNLNLEDWLTMFSIDPEPSRYVGKKVKVMGFYYLDENGNPSIGKYVISCCIADARIMGIWLTKPLSYHPDTWLEMEGTLKEIDLDGQRNIGIEVTNLKQIETPKDPYATK